MKELMRKKTVKMTLLLIVLLVAAVIIGINAQSAQRQKEYDNHIEAAQKYLTELDYEQAIVEFDKAIAIDPMCVDAYLGKADAYIGMGELQSAIDTLQSGYELTEDERLKEKLDEVEAQITQIRQAEEEARQAEEDARLAAEEEAKSEEIKRLVAEKEEELIQVDLLYGAWTFNDMRATFLPATRVEELCRPLVELLEQYKAFYPDDYFNTWDYLPHYYYLLGEYEMCLETRKQIHELQLIEWEQSGSDPESYPYKYATEVIEIDSASVTYTYDEYGRKIKEQVGDYLYEYEYGENGRIAQKVQIRGSRSRETFIYEYDSLGRILKMVENYNNISPFVGSGTTEFVFTYNEKSVTEHVSNTNDVGTVEYQYYYEIDEYGKPTELSP